MPLTTGPIENTGNQPANASSVQIKVLNLTGGLLTGVVRVFKLNGTRQLLSTTPFAAASNASTFVTPSVSGTFQYEVEIVPNQTGGIYSVYGRTAGGTIITAQRFVNSELTSIL
ncbi:ATPase [Rummeliibacillus sp. NPDC094406]|uniref:ATPase n=1 Tax=Rummeliibacillus sp. NPDC094406 TaxID=3364511 RepID=UPI003820C509